MVALQKRTRAQHKSPSLVGELLQPLLTKYGLHRSFQEYHAMRVFACACGPWLAQNARAERLRKGVLYVRVAHATWSHEIESMKDTLLSRVQAFLGTATVRSFRFVVGNVHELPDWLDTPEPFRSPSMVPLQGDATVWQALQTVTLPELYQTLTACYRAAQEAPEPTRP